MSDPKVQALLQDFARMVDEAADELVLEGDEEIGQMTRISRSFHEIIQKESPVKLRVGLMALFAEVVEVFISCPDLTLVKAFAFYNAMNQTTASLLNDKLMEMNRLADMKPEGRA